MTTLTYNDVGGDIGRTATVVGQGDDSQRWVFGGGADKMVHKWNLQSGEWTSVLTGHIRDIHAVCAVPGKPMLLSTGQDGLLKIWYVDGL
jgi:WD40 repeat protein